MCFLFGYNRAMDFSRELDKKVLQQAVRDIASKNPRTSTEAKAYFLSQDFEKLCTRNSIDSDTVKLAVVELNEYPIVSKKKLANKISKLIEGQ